MTDQGLDNNNVEIFVVEDSPTQAEELRYMLKRHGFSVSVAANGVEALAKIRERKPTIVISDIVMPEMDGYRLCREIKNDDMLKDLHVILLTSLSDPRDVLRGLECGADNFITKPYDEKYMLSRIQYILANMHLRDVEQAQLGLEVRIVGEKYLIKADRIQILNLLLSSYDTAVQKNGELVRAQDELRTFNARLEQKVRERTAELTEEIKERKIAEARIIRQNALLNAINGIFLEVLGCETEEIFCKKCLAAAEALTGSRFGIITELNPAGRLDTIALSDPGWSACRIPQSNAVLMLKDIEVRGIQGSVIRNGTSAIINDPASCPERAGTPDGHPEITCFLGVPLKQAGNTIGMIGLANKEGGYDEIDREAVESLATAIVEALMRLRAENKIRKLNADLEQRVFERTAQLEFANNELEAFTYSVTHDLRAPLRSINGFSRVLREDCSVMLDVTGKDSLERIISATERMDQLIDDLFDLSRVLRTEMRRQRVDLSENARIIAERLKEAQPERHVEFIIADGLVSQGDEHLLTVVLENLLNNSWKFTGEKSHGVIEIGTVEHEGRLAYFVRDNGAGFDMAYGRKLFNPFQRLHSVEQFPGTGIGLATVKRIINRHGGTVWAEGKKGEGACFYFTLPMHNEVDANGLPR